MNLAVLAARCARVRPKKIHLAWPLLIMTALYWLSSLPGTPSPEDPAAYFLFYWLPPWVQNALHVPAYALLTWAWRWVLGAWLRASGTRSFAACSIALAYGVFDEWHQSSVPGRYASLMDLVFDAAGAALGVWLAARASRYAASSTATIAARDPRAQQR